MKRHGLHMLIGCGLPLILLLVLPRFGVSNNVTLILAIALMIGCHLFMGMGHKGKGMDHNGKDSEE